jgi:hypothetical protein
LAGVENCFDDFLWWTISRWYHTSATVYGLHRRPTPGKEILIDQHIKQIIR